MDAATAIISTRPPSHFRFAPAKPHCIHRPLRPFPLPRRSIPPSLSLSLSLSFPRRRSIRALTPDTESDLAGGGGGGEGRSSGGGGGGGSGREGEGEEGEEKKKMSGMSMSQKLTLGYAALVGAGGAMGYFKTGSQKSLLAGGSSALILYYVYTQLPVNPVFASSVGLGISAALLAVMGSRFKRSGKVFPAGVVSLVSLIMTGGYFHGILRSMH